MAEDVYTIQLTLSKPDGEAEQRFVGWFHGPTEYGMMIAQRSLVFQQATGNVRIYSVTPRGKIGFWKHLKELLKGLLDISEWYDVFWVPVGYALEPASMLQTRIPMGYFWSDDVGLNDFICDLGGEYPMMEPRIIMFDRKRQRWIFGADDLPRIYDTAGQEGELGLVTGRICRG